MDGDEVDDDINVDDIDDGNEDDDNIDVDDRKVMIMTMMTMRVKMTLKLRMLELAHLQVPVLTVLRLRVGPQVGPGLHSDRAEGRPARPGERGQRLPGRAGVGQ